MSRGIFFLIVFGLAVHGLIHLMGFVAYWPLGSVAELPYKTALAGGRWEIGAAGMRLFSLLWLVAAAGFVLAALGLVLNWEWWRTLLWCTTLLSLLISTLDWSVAFRGAIIDLVLLALLALLPWIGAWLPATLAQRILV